jgi:hypothetical protein
MQWEFIVALLLGIPVILFPVALVWFLNIGGLYAAIKEAKERRAAREEATRAVADKQRKEKEFVSVRQAER